ncbi:hypothetical protein VN23_01415 [Janthinobacterium sp. B9-8]|nr:hypothetical protein VN23_01415 [Janthinobacterium sp. B9-8]
MNGQEKNQKKAAPGSTNPLSADNRAAAAELASLRQASKKPRPLVPRFGVLQGDFKKPHATRSDKLIITGVENAQKLIGSNLIQSLFFSVKLRVLRVLRGFRVSRFGFS